MPAKETERWIERFARWGLIAIGISFVLTAIIVARVAATGSGEPHGRTGAIESLAREPLGKILLPPLALGFAGYGAWRIVTAVIGETLENDDKKGVGQRVFAFARGAFYAGLAFVCVAMLFRPATRSSGSGGGEQKAAAAIFSLPGGRVIVAAVGGAVIAAGAWSAYRAVTGRFRKDLKTWQMDRDEERWLTKLAVAGLLSRLALYLLIGGFLLDSAIRYDPDKAVGFDGALQRLAGTTYGRPALALAALAFLLYGGFRFLEARYRKI